MTEEATLAAEDTRPDRGAGRPEPVPLVCGQTVARYVVLSRIGSGGMGIVYAAYDPQLDRKVALKVLHTRLAASPSGHRRLLREAQATARLSHPNVVTIHDVGEHAGQIFLALELVDGDTLRAWQARTQPSVREILHRLALAGRGLAAAHAAGIVHRDFKPDNVLVGHDGGVYVSDFGLARASQSGEASGEGASPAAPAGEDATGFGRTEGTPAYMAPEQLGGDPIDPRADVFAFCVTAYEALFGVRPYRGDTTPEIVAAIVDGRIDRTGTSRRVPTRLRRAIERGLAVDPDDRWPDLTELLGELERDPARRKRWLAVGSLVAIAATGGAVYDRVDHAGRLAACHDAGAAIEDVWSPAVRTEVERALQAADPRRGAADLERLAEPLDAYTQAWRAAREQACLAVEVEHAQTRTWRTVVDACLDERRAAIDAVVGALREPDAETSRRAIGAIMQLPALSTCTDPAFVARRSASSLDGADDATRARVAEVREQLAAVRGLMATARVAQATERVQRAVAAAEEIGDPATVALSGYYAGAIARWTSDYPAAREQLERAYYQALGAGADEVALDVATELTYLVGYMLSERATGLAWGRTAQALLDRLDLHDDEHTALLFNQIGTVHRAAGELEPAIESHQRALQIRERVFGPEHLVVAMSLNNLANAHNDAGQRRAAIEEHGRALAIREHVLDPDHPDIAVSLMNLANVHAALGRHDEAEPMMQRALGIYERTMGPEHEWVADVLSNLGVVYQQSRRPEQALRVQQRALQIRQRIPGQEDALADSRVNLGTVMYDLRRLDEAADELDAAIAVYEERFGPVHPSVAQAASMLGLVRGQQGDSAAARAAFSRALKIREEVFGPDSTPVAASQFDLGMIDLREGDAAGALTRFDRGLPATDGDDAPPGLRTDLLAGRGLAQLELGRRAAAIESFEHALAVAGEGGVDPSSASVAAFGLARALADDDPPRARALAEQARDGWSAVGPRGTADLQRVEAWLGAHPQAPQAPTP